MREGISIERAVARDSGSFREFLRRLEGILPELSAADRKAIGRAEKLFDELDKPKRIHSRNVALVVAGVLGEIDAVLAALLHDTKEEIPKEFEKRKKNVRKPVRSLVSALSETSHATDGTDEEEANVPLAHLRRVLPELSQPVKNKAIVIKLADRLDNVQKRLASGTLSQKYQDKSRALFQYLALEYRPDGEIAIDRLRLLTGRIAELLSCDDPFADIR